MERLGLFGAIAEFYQQSMDSSCDYGAWADYVINRIKTYSQGNSGIDAACGSGQFTRALKKAGFNVCGVDISEEMLVAAEKENAANGVFVQYIKGDLTKLKFPHKVDFITAINDAFNCLDGENMKKAFARLNLCLKKGGVLLFDVSSEYKLKNVIANNVFFEDEDNYAYIWTNKLFDDRVEMELTAFVRRKAFENEIKKVFGAADKDCELFEKKESALTEYIHTESEIVTALEKSGFKIVAIEGESGTEKKPDSERLNFIALKI